MKRLGARLAFAILVLAAAAAYAAEPPRVAVAFDAGAKGRPIPPGAFGYGVMYTREMVRDFCPAAADYETCRAILTRELAPRIRALGARAISYGVDSGLGTHSDPLAGTDPWGGPLALRPEHLCAFAKAAGAEALAFGVPIRGMVPILKTISERARAATVAYARAMDRAVGCEDLPRYAQIAGEMTPLGGAPWAAADHFALNEAVARAIARPGLTFTIYALNWFPARDPRLLNRPIYDLVMRLRAEGLPVAADFHEYQALPEWAGPATVDLGDPEVLAATLQAGARRAGFMRIDPARWGGRGERAPGVIFEFAMEAGRVPDGARAPCLPAPFAVQIAEAGILFQAVAEDALPALAWALIAGEGRRGGWCYGALANREPTQRARTLEFAARDLRGDLLAAFAAGGLRGFVVRRPDGAVVVTGGNFSLAAAAPAVAPRGAALRVAEVQVYDASGERRLPPGDGARFVAAPATLFRVVYEPERPRTPNS